jgi:hypothetical protein
MPFSDCIARAAWFKKLLKIGIRSVTRGTFSNEGEPVAAETVPPLVTGAIERIDIFFNRFFGISIGVLPGTF